MVVVVPVLDIVVSVGYFCLSKVSLAKLFKFKLSYLYNYIIK